MTSQKSKLAMVFSEIAAQGDKLDNVAVGFMKLVKEDMIDNLEKFNPWIATAYEENGWSSQVGPRGGSTLGTAPRAVKQYVSMFRAAFKLELKVLEFDTVRQMVDAVVEARRLLATPPVKIADPELKGVLLRSTGHMNGALWHDAIVVIENLNEEDKDDFEQRLRKLVMRFQSKVPKEIRKPKAA
jgi:hypothetical protein